MRASRSITPASTIWATSSTVKRCGVIDRDARMELLDGELIDMPSEGELHILFKTELVRALAKALSDSLAAAPDASLHLATTDAPEPDIYVFESGSRLKPIDPGAVRLTIEIADTSLGYDLGRKAAKYAAYGLAEYWVVDIGSRQTHVLKRPLDGAYREITAVSFDDELAPAHIRELRLVISKLPNIAQALGPART